jgi:hypothetical protein
MSAMPKLRTPEKKKNLVNVMRIWFEVAIKEFQNVLFLVNFSKWSIPHCLVAKTG